MVWSQQSNSRARARIARSDRAGATIWRRNLGGCDRCVRGTVHSPSPKGQVSAIASQCDPVQSDLGGLRRFEYRRRPVIQTGCGRNRSLVGSSAPVAKASGTRRRAGADRLHGGGHERSADGEGHTLHGFPAQYRHCSQNPVSSKLGAVRPGGSDAKSGRCVSSPPQIQQFIGQACATPNPV